MAGAIGAGAGTAADGVLAAEGLTYPPTRKSDHVDVYHGVKVADPFRWLEDPDAPESRQWIEAQNKVTFGFLRSIPEREAIRKRLTELWDYEKYGLPAQRGGRYFFIRNTGLQNQAVLYVAEALEGEPRVLLDPNTFSKDGTVALSSTAASEDGKLLAYAVAKAGSDWMEWRVRDVDTGRDREDHLRWAKFSGAAWTLDGKGFFYSRYDAPKAGEELRGQNFYHKIYYHRLGTPQEEDVLVYHRPDQKEWYLSGRVTEDGRYFVISASHGTRRENRVFYQDLQDPLKPVVSPEASPIRPLLDQADAQYSFINNDGPVFWFETDRDASRGRVVAIDLRNPAPDRWTEVIPEAKETLQNATVVGERFFVTYLKDAHTQVRMFALDGNPKGEVPLPGIGTASGFGGRRKDGETFYSFTSYLQPGAVYRYDRRKDSSQVYRAPKLAYDPHQYETKQVFYRSKDGTRIPMFISHRKGLKLDGENPTYLYGYGGFMAPMVPGFSPAMLAWMEMGGVFAVANLRGGGEYGREWYEAGIKERKQNVFDDFIAAAEWLIAHRHTSSRKLAIGGGSNGGLLVGAAMTQRPDLFAAALPAVGVMDMLRFHKFTVGWGWTSDYGSSDDPEEFRVLHAYSPLHNLRPGTRYPATLVTTADHDDRVVPAHSFKFAATLQAAQAGPAPVLIRIETDAGHGAGKPTAKVIEEAADRWAFLVKALLVSAAADDRN